MEPITCSLTTIEAAHQAVGWRRLGQAARAVVVQEGRLTATFPIEAAADIESLVAREAACCSFLSIAASDLGDMVRLDISSSRPEAGPLIEALGAVMAG